MEKSMVCLIIVSIVTMQGQDSMSSSFLYRRGSVRNDQDARTANDNPESGAYIAEENLDRDNTIEGDILLDWSTSSIMDQLMNPSREALVDPIRLWPGARVPYEFGPVIDSVKNAFHEAIRDFEKYTCIKFVNRTTESNYVYVVSEGGCWSPIGRSRRLSSSGQKLSLGTYCDRKGTAIHELMHTLGFFHEQSRLDRDNYITVHLDNVKYGMSSNFEKYPHGKADSLGAAYDYKSIMHYPKYAFTSNGRATIVPKDPNASIGQRKRLSDIDIEQVNKLYKCGAPKPPTTTPTPTTAACMDRYQSCYFYAWYGFCEVYKSFMKVNCRKSCNHCG